MRVSIVVAVGAMGEDKDLQEFMELCRADFEHRAVEIATDLLGGRVTILPMSETFGDDEVPEPTRPPS